MSPMVGRKESTCPISGSLKPKKTIRIKMSVGEIPTYGFDANRVPGFWYSDKTNVQGLHWHSRPILSSVHLSPTPNPANKRKTPNLSTKCICWNTLWSNPFGQPPVSLRRPTARLRPHRNAGWHNRERSRPENGLHLSEPVPKTEGTKPSPWSPIIVVSS